MTHAKPNITVNVDVTNPGQFFACCGLLELAARIDPYTLARFDSGHFAIHANVRAVLDCFFKCEVNVDTSATSKNVDEAGEVDDNDDINSHRGRIYPMTLCEPFNLRLDWWNDEEAQRQKLKTWTAGQRVTDLLVGYHKRQKRKGKTEHTYIPSMREHFAEAVKRCPDDWLREARPIEVPMAFSYDSRLSRNNALDQGHKAKSIMAFSPAVDVLTLVGLQRFRPLMLETWTHNLYCTWSEPLPVEIAAVTALGLIPQLTSSCFEFPIKRCDAQGRYKLFGHAQPVRNPPCLTY
jgi:CRISPR-associated protein Csb3